MRLGKPINIRLSLEKEYMMKEDAAREGKALSSYIREYVEKAYDTQREVRSLRRDIIVLRHIVEDFAQKTNNSDAALVEILLLLRHLCNPEQRQEVRADMQRMGLEVWKHHES